MQDAAFYNCTGAHAIHFTGHIAPFGHRGYGGAAPAGDGQQHSDASFAAMNLVSHWEYTRNVTWLRTVGYAGRRAAK